MTWSSYYYVYPKTTENLPGEDYCIYEFTCSGDPQRHSFLFPRFLNSASVKLNILLSRGNFSPTGAFRNSERLVQSRDTGYETA